METHLSQELQKGRLIDIQKAQNSESKIHNSNYQNNQFSAKINCETQQG